MNAQPRFTFGDQVIWTTHPNGPHHGIVRGIMQTDEGWKYSLAETDRLMNIVSEGDLLPYTPPQPEITVHDIVEKLDRLVKFYHSEAARLLDSSRGYATTASGRIKQKNAYEAAIANQSIANAYRELVTAIKSNRLEILRES